LLSFASVEHITLLDPLDVGGRIDELKQLKPGWLDGEGSAPDVSGLDWFGAAFDRFFPDELPSPYLYPTVAGGVRAEWSIAPIELSVEVDLAKHIGHCHALNLDDDSEVDRTLNLDVAADWDWLAQKVRDVAMVKV
jgi:hypothetical protein